MQKPDQPRRCERNQQKKDKTLFLQTSAITMWRKADFSMTKYTVKEC